MDLSSHPPSSQSPSSPPPSSPPSSYLQGTFLSLLLGACLAAQSNAVPGMDARIYDVTDLAAYGRRGAAYPNGEAGFHLGHSYCNAGSVNIPWVATSGGLMIDTYPKIAFLLARESGGRMVQISGKTYLKHSTAVYNFSSGPCAPCNNTGGQFFFVGCSDTYSSGINSNRTVLGPTTEINPWLGTWDSQGSYFDRGDPSVGGAAATDRVKSLTSTMVGAFDAIKNRLEVRESELVVPGSFWGQIQLVIQGEPVANRQNNIQNRPVSFNWNGTAWGAGASGSSLTGSVLTQWTGATWDEGSNGSNDGRFLVAVKVTPLGGNQWHYEYAVHNLDNHRGGGRFDLPIATNGTVSNLGFRDIDADASNDWVGARNGNRITFTGPSNNPLDWNTFYNVWFDCDVSPSLGAFLVDESRTGAGVPTVTIMSQVPSGVPSATLTSVGSGCGDCAASFYEEFASAPSFDLSNSSMTMTLTNGAYTVRAGTSTFVTPSGGALQLSDDSEVTITLPFSLPYPGGSTTQMFVCSNGFISPGGSNGTSFTPAAAPFLAGLPRWAAAWHDLNPGTGGQVIFDSSASEARVTWLNVPNFAGGGTATFQYQFLPNGTVHVLWQAMNPAGNAYLVGWTPGSGAANPGSRDLSATLPGGFGLCASNFQPLTLSSSARPILGTTVTLTTANIPPATTFGFMLVGFNQLVPPLNLTPFGMPGCFAHALDGTTLGFAPTGATYPLALSIPGGSNFTGVRVITQSYTYSPPLTPLGVIASNGLILGLGPQ